MSLREQSAQQRRGVAGDIFISCDAIGPKRARSREEQTAISGSLALLANVVMAWNTYRMQAIADRPTSRLAVIGLDELVQLGPVSTRHINFRGVLHFPLEEYAQAIILCKRVPVPRAAA
jgi:hypothetical protein